MLPALVACVALAGCAEPGAQVQAGSLDEHVRRLAPAVERAAGLTFKTPPVVAVRSREQVRGYLLAKLAEELPPEELEGMRQAYRLLGLVPDTLDLGALLLDLYTEQVAGYFDPDSNTLYAVAGAEPTQLAMVLAHELVHALQAQYVDLDSLLFSDRSSNDRTTAVHAVVEGQATLYGIRVLMPESDLTRAPGFWKEIRQVIRTQQAAMPVFSHSPLVIRESLIFPYLAGADFVRWYDATHPRGRLPFGVHAPQSTEQVLHTERYRARDAPVPITFDSLLQNHVTYENELGEFEIRLLFAQMEGESAATGAPLGWGGDRYRVYDGEALVWYSVWDSAPVRDRFLQRLTPLWTRGPGTRPEYRTELEAVDHGGHPGARLAFAPSSWEGWAQLPAARFGR